MGKSADIQIRLSRDLDHMKSGKENIVGSTIELLIGEPWDFHDPCGPDTIVRGSYPFYAVIVAVTSRDAGQPAFVIKTEKPFRADGQAVQYLLATNRYSPEDQDIIGDFKSGKPVSMNFTYRKDRADFSADELSTISWGPEYGGLSGGLVASDGKMPFKARL